MVVAYHKYTQRVFGGFVEDVFTGENKCIAGHSTNFIFSLVQGLPIKLTHDPKDISGVWLDTSSYGLVLGGGVDLLLFNDSSGSGECDPSTYTIAHPDYPHSTPIAKGQLAGLSGGLYEWKGEDVIVEVFQCSA